MECHQGFFNPKNFCTFRSHTFPTNTCGFLYRKKGLFNYKRRTCTISKTACNIFKICVRLKKLLVQLQKLRASL